MKLLLIIVWMSVLTSCSRSVVYLNNVRHAADIALPADLDTVLVVNRYKVEKGGGKQVLSVLEGMVTGEPILGDKYGSDESVENMKRLIRSSDRLTLASNEIQIVKRADLDGETPIKAAVVDSLCKRYNADGVIALENFDSDNFYTHASSSVRTNWRIYYPEGKTMVDELSIYSSGYAQYNPYTMVPPQHRAIANAGAYGAQLYYNRIVPWWAKESRQYYGYGGKEFKLGKRAVKRRDWDQAIFFWQSFLENSSDMKKNGFAAYNLALAYEVKMDFENALSWIDQSVKYGNRHARAYQSTLNFRANEQPLIEDQLKRE